jgi:hypothetical protein
MFNEPLKHPEITAQLKYISLADISDSSGSSNNSSNSSLDLTNLSTEDLFNRIRESNKLLSKLLFKQFELVNSELDHTKARLEVEKLLDEVYNSRNSLTIELLGELKAINSNITNINIKTFELLLNREDLNYNDFINTLNSPKKLTELNTLLNPIDKNEVQSLASSTKSNSKIFESLHPFTNFESQTELPKSPSSSLLEVFDKGKTLV